MFPSRLLAGCLTVTFVALAGCGESDPVRTDRPILRLTVDEYRINPQNSSVRPGRIKITVLNTGRLTHNIVIQTPATEPRDRPMQVPGGRVKSMKPGEEAEPIKVTLAPGTYRIACTIANHDDLGQFGELVVEGEPL
ncbi:MAG: hypothetical protein ACR2LK_12170 [Solirubrobacteraceae bacterium]